MTVSEAILKAAAIRADVPESDQTLEPYRRLAPAVEPLCGEGADAWTDLSRLSELVDEAAGFLEPAE